VIVLFDQLVIYRMAMDSDKICERKKFDWAFVKIFQKDLDSDLPLWNICIVEISLMGD